MTDISKYKNVSLKKDIYTNIDYLRRVLVPNTIISRSQTVSILVNEKVKKLNGKLPEADSYKRKRKRSRGRRKR